MPYIIATCFYCIFKIRIGIFICVHSISSKSRLVSTLKIPLQKRSIFSQAHSSWLPPSHILPCSIQSVINVRKDILWMILVLKFDKLFWNIEGPMKVLHTVSKISSFLFRPPMTYSLPPTTTASANPLLLFIGSPSIHEFIRGSKISRVECILSPSSQPPKAYLQRDLLL